MDIRLKRAPGLYLTGFMGTGKSTIAKLLSDRLGWDYVDLDAVIEESQHEAIANIFASRGEAEFRRIESDMLKAIVRRVERGMPSVVALGGGTFVQPANAAMLDDHGISIWLDCSLETIESRIEDPSSRPLMQDREAFRKLYEARRAAYSRAQYRVDVEGDVSQAVETIMQLPFWK